MTAEQRAIAGLFCITAAYYGRPISDAVAQMYALDLDDLSPTTVASILKRLRGEPKRRTCPLPAEVREAARPQNDQMSAEQLAARIVGAIGRYGHPNARAARAYLGETAWAALEDLGGWHDVCSRLKADQVPTFTAQARELCRAHLDRTPDPTPPALPPSSPDRDVRGLLQDVGVW